MDELSKFLLHSNYDLDFCNSSCNKAESEIQPEDCRKCFLKYITERATKSKNPDWKDAVMGHFVRVE